MFNIFISILYYLYLIINTNGIQMESNSAIANNYLWVNVFQSI